MVVVETLRNGKQVHTSIDSKARVPTDASWVDIWNPNDEERRWVGDLYGFSIPDEQSIVEIEATSRFFEDKQGVHLRSYFFQERPEGIANVTVAFLVSERCLFTLHYQDVLEFQDFSKRICHKPDAVSDSLSVLLGLLETHIDRVADVLEKVYADVDDFANTVFRIGEKDLASVVDHLAGVEDVNSRTRFSLMDKQHVLSMLSRNAVILDRHGRRLNEILRDVDSLIAHSNFLFEKTNFFMDVTMGKINVEQNKIIKILSIAAVVFLPPTLVASLYGMNFHVMPELSWRLGYPLAVVLMFLSGIAPYGYFKHKGWL